MEIKYSPTCPFVLPASLNSASLMAASFCEATIFGGEKSSSSISILEWPFFGVLGEDELNRKTSIYPGKISFDFALLHPKLG